MLTFNHVIYTYFELATARTLHRDHQRHQPPGPHSPRSGTDHRLFTELLGWQLLARDDNYPRTTVSDGTARLTLWQADRTRPVTGFDRKTNIGLHHLALEVSSEEKLLEIAEKVKAWPGVEIEFMPEPLGGAHAGT